MIVRGPRPQQSFTVVANAIIEHTGLSWKAKGLLIYLLSKPDHWRTSAQRLAHVGPDGRDSIRAGLNELQQHGYLVRRYKQDAQGRWTTTTTIYDHPHYQGVDNDDAGCGQPVDN